MTAPVVHRAGSCLPTPHPLRHHVHPSIPLPQLGECLGPGQHHQLVREAPGCRGRRLRLRLQLIPLLLHPFHFGQGEELLFQVTEGEPFYAPQVGDGLSQEEEAAAAIGEEKVFTGQQARTAAAMLFYFISQVAEVFEEMAANIEVADSAKEGRPVLDCHVHPLFLDDYTPEGLAYTREMNPAALEDAGRMEDPSAFAQLLAAMGVTHAVLLATEAPLVAGMVTSEKVVDFAAGSRGLYAFVCLNPWLTGDMVGRLEQLRQRGPVAGVKLLPSYQHFWPNSAMMYPLYARLEELRLPVTFHTGTSRFRGTMLKYAQPLLLDEVAVRFPQLPILMAHAGRGVWYEEAALLAQLHREVYLDISGLPPRNLPTYFPRLFELKEKLVFGSDFPGVPSLSRNIAAVREIFGADATKVLWENGARILGLMEHDT